MNTKYYSSRPVIGKIVVLPEIGLLEFEPEVPWAGISIIDSKQYDKGRRAKTPYANRVGLLEMGFDDITKPICGFRHFTHEQALEVWNFIDDVWSEIDLLMVHCLAGLSRSSAVAKSISKIHQSEFSHFFDEFYTPNRLIFNKMIETKFPIL